MSDPLSRLGSLGSSGGAPDLDAIKLRAHRLQRRRQTGLAGAGAAAMAIVAVVGVLLVTGPGGDKVTTLDSALSAPTPTSSAGSRLSGVSAPEEADAEAPTARSVGGGAVTSGASGAAAGAEAPSSEGRASADTAAAAPARGEAKTVEPELEATVSVADQPIGRGKTFTLKVCNTTSGSVTREFGSSQRYDFEVSRGGKLVWRWSDGQFFTQVVGSETWAAGACKEWSENWDGSSSGGGRAGPDEYAVVGILKSQPEVRSASKSFSLSAL